LKFNKDIILNKKLLLVMCLVVLISNVSFSLAAVVFHPRLTMIESYNDNIFLDSNAAESDWITTTEPAFSLNADSKLFTFDLDYALRFRHYQKHSRENETHFSDVQRALLDAMVFPGRDFTLGLTEEVSRVFIDERAAAIAENELVNRTNLFRSVVNPQYRWHVLSTFSAVVGYRFEKLDYESAVGNDSHTHHFDLSLLKSISTKTDIKFNVFQDDTTSTRRTGYQLRQVSVGLNRKFGPRWMVDIMGGLAQSELDTGSNDQDSVGFVHIDGPLAKNISLSLAVDRSFVLSVADGLMLRSQASTTLKSSGNNNIEAVIYGREDRFLIEDRTDRSLGGGLTTVIPLKRKIALVTRADLVKFYFLPGDEEALRYGVGVFMRYTGNKGLISLGDTIRVNNSNIEVNDYINNIATLTVGLRF